MTHSDQRIPMLPQSIVDSFDYASLPLDWIPSDLSRFSTEKSLYVYQQNALMNCAKGLYLYFMCSTTQSTQEKNPLELKKAWFNRLMTTQRLSGQESDILGSLGVDGGTRDVFFETLAEYYTSEARNPSVSSHKHIPFWNYVNRIGFWMATGSGKSLVLIKIVEILDEYMRRGLLGAGNKRKVYDILVLSYREDLLQQLRSLVAEYNRGKGRRIALWDLRDYDRVKTGQVLVQESSMNVFMYRSDLISDTTTEANISFRDVDNGGHWFVLLDEAHKGDPEESKRQQYYSILSRNGFLFNFSATFTDPWDIVTTVFNFNLSEFIKEGYGKNVYLMHDEDTLDIEEEMDEGKKRSLILQMLILFSYISVCRTSLLSASSYLLYHHPLLVILGKTVNTSDADLEIVFRLLEEAANGHVQANELEAAKKSLIERFEKHRSFCFGSEEISFDRSRIENIGLHDILRNAFHSSTHGAIEVLRNPSDTKQIAFKLKTADRPFALIKIGDITTWLRAKLTGYEVVDTFDDRSYFSRLGDEDSPITILMGAQAFYEGWDSNRPNIMAFINIGIGDAKKYVLQAIGRGIRIEPIAGKRKRLIHIINASSEGVASTDDQCPPPQLLASLETLFVFGTSEKNIERLLEGIRYIEPNESLLLELKKNPAVDALQIPLLVPVYSKSSSIPIADLPEFSGNRELLREFDKWLDDDIVLYAILCTERGEDLPISTLRATESFIQSGSFFRTDRTDILVQMQALSRFVESQLEHVDGYRELVDEIIHFRQVSTTLGREDAAALKKAIARVASYRNPETEKAKLRNLLREGLIDDSEFDRLYAELTTIEPQEQFDSLDIRYISSHYYLPVVLSDDGKGQYVKHIISEESERRFILNLVAHLSREDNAFHDVDFWMFSKLVERVDGLFIPFYSSIHNDTRRYFPDFVFWIRKGPEYHIVFVDPKGPAYSDYQEKIDGFVRLFWKDGRPRIFAQDSLEISVHLKMYGSKSTVAEGYKAHWIDDVSQIREVL